MYFLFKVFNLLFIFYSLISEFFFIVCHFLHEVFFFFGEVEFEGIVHIVVDLFWFWLVLLLSFDHDLYLFFELVDMDLVLFLSSLVLLHHVLSGCYCAFVLLDCILQQLDFVGDVVDHCLFYLYYPLQLLVLTTQFFLFIVQQLCLRG